MLYGVKIRRQGMAEITAIFTFLGTLSSPAQFLIYALLLYILVNKLSTFNEYKVGRRHTTTNKTLSYTEAVLKNIRAEAIANMRKIMVDARGSEGLSEMDRLELGGVRLAITESLDLQTKSHIKTILRENGYYRKIKDKEDISDIIHQRSTELRNISLTAVDDVIRDSSPLQGVAEQRFSYAKSEELFKTIVDKHYQEILDEEADINSKVNELFWVFGKLYIYTHDGIRKPK